MALETATIEQTQFLSAKPVEVYDALVNPKKHSEFTGAKATGGAVAGGEFTAYDGYISGTYVELVRARKIVQDWRTSEWPEGYPPSRLEFQFAPKDDGTEVTMTHAQVPAAQADAYRQGWVDYYWKPIEEYFSGR